MGGRLEADLRWDTRMSSIELEQYEQVDLAGSLNIMDLLVEAPDIPVPVELQKMEMVFNPRLVELVTMDLVLGSSDLHLDGELTNFIPYVFDGKTVSGFLNVVSTRFDANELMPENTQGVEDAGTTEDTGVEIAVAPPDSLALPIQVRIPENLDFKLSLDMKNVIYDQVELSNLEGDLWSRKGWRTWRGFHWM